MPYALRHLRTFVTWAGVMMGVWAGATAAWGQQQRPYTIHLSADEVETRGDDLRLAIEMEFASLHVTHIPLPGERQWAPTSGGSDASGFVKRYVPLGLPISQAEAILERAGLTITRGRTPYRPDRPPYAYGTSAFKRETVNGTPRHILVQLDPQDQSDDAPVVALRAYMRKDDSPPRP